MKQIIIGFALLCASPVLAEVVELECTIDENINVYLIDLETDEVTHGDGGQFSNVSISPIAVGFAAYYEPEGSPWLMQRTNIQRDDLQITQSFFELDGDKIKGRRVGKGLLTWNFKVGKITPWSDDVRPDDWEFKFASEGLCKLVERERAF